MYAVTLVLQKLLVGWMFVQHSQFHKKLTLLHRINWVGWSLYSLASHRSIIEIFVKETCIRGYHIYNVIREAEVGDELECRRERSNRVDCFAVAVVSIDTEVGHEPQKISRACSLFLRRGGGITCRTVGTRKYSTDLPQGGLPDWQQVVSY